MNKSTAVATTLLVLLVTGIVSACEMIAFPPSEPSAWSMAFEGLVKAHVSRAIPFDDPVTAPGLLVEVVDPLARVESGQRLEVFPMGTGLECELVPRDTADIYREYPVGTRVSVVGWTLDGHPQLVLTGADEFGHVARVPVDAPVTSRGFLDFHAYRDARHPAPKGGFSRVVAWANANHRWFEDFAFFRCLIALGSDMTTVDRVSLLENLAYYSGYHRFDEKMNAGFYRDLLKKQDISRRDRKRLRKAFGQAAEAG